MIDIIDPKQAATVGADLAVNMSALAGRVQLGPLVDVVMVEQAVIDRQDVGAAIRTVETYFAPLKGMAYKLWRALCDRENEIVQPLQRVDRELSTRIAKWKADEDASRAAREREEADRRQREQEERAITEAAAFEAQGDPVLAAAVLAEAVEAPAPVVVLPDVARSVPDLKFVKRWHYRVANAALVPREYWLLDDKKLGAYARAMKESARVPGIEFYSTQEPVR